MSSWCVPMTVVWLLLLVALTVNATAPAPQRPDCGRRTLIKETIRASDGLMAGGAFTNNSNAPWHVAVFSNVRDRKYYAYGFGGSLLTGRVVLTAAHSIWNTVTNKPHTANRFKVQAGAYHRKLPGRRVRQREPLDVQVRLVQRIFTPDDYPNAVHTADGDLALLELSKSIVFKFYIQPICLPAEPFAVPSAAMGTVAGWGYTRDEKTYSNDLKVLNDVPWIERNACASSLFAQNVGDLVTEKTVCAGFTNGQSMCPGDDGGALAIPRLVDGREVFHVYGVVTDMRRLNENCDQEAYTVFASVSYYVKWIRDKLDVVGE